MSAPVLLAVFFTVGWIPLLVFRTETLSRAMPVFERGERFWVLVSPLLLGTHIALSCWFLSREPALPVWRVLTSVALFTAGIALWVWTRSLIGPMLSPRQPDEPPREFIVDGPFRWVRNPSFFGTLLAAAATSLAAGRGVLVATLALAGWTLWIRAGQEERRMLRYVGPRYAAYQRKVRRLVPFLF